MQKARDDKIFSNEEIRTIITAVGTGVGVALFIAYWMTTTPPEVTSAELLNAAVIEKGPCGLPVPEVDVDVTWMGFMMTEVTVVE